MKNLTFILLTLPFFSFAQDAGCIDSTAIDPDCMCIDMYDPVLGCNGETYSNDCYAQCDGVQSWSPLNQAQSSVCDSIDLDILSANNNFIEFEFFANFSSSQSVGYAGFILIDEFGDTVATELAETANNVYGINGGMNETRFLYPTDFGYELPLDGSIHLIEGFFSGNYDSFCYLDLSTIHTQASENDTVDLSGQWYSEDEDEYLVFDSDSLHTFSYDSISDCYPKFSLSYQANDSTIYFESDGEVFSINYSLTSSVFSVFFEGEAITYLSDSSIIDLCVDETYDCTANECVSVDGLDGEFDSLEDCQLECEAEQIETWDCVDGSCESLNDSTGQYSSYQSCVDSCNVTDITDYKLSKKIIKVTDLLGREVSPDSDQIIIIYYKDGSVEKKYFLKR